MKEQRPQQTTAELQADVASARQDLAIALEELAYQMQPAVQAQELVDASAAKVEDVKEKLKKLWEGLRKGEKEAWIDLAELVGASTAIVLVSVLAFKHHLRVKDQRRQQRRWKKALRQLAKQEVPAGVEISVF